MPERRSTPILVEYNSNDEQMQALLRLALFDVWNGRCHWCRKGAPDATYLEIDHILPQSRFAELTGKLTIEDEKVYRKRHLASIRSLPPSAHDVLNLAPICAAGRRCNQEKADAIDSRTYGSIRTSLKRAGKKSKRVTRMVRTMLQSQGIEQHLVGIVAMPATAETRRLVQEYGQFILRSVWQADKVSFDRFRAPSEIKLDVDLGEVPDFFSDATRTGSGVDGVIYLNDEERIALSSAQILFEVDADDLLSEAITNAVSDIDAEVEAEELGDVEYPALEGPRWLRVKGQRLLPGPEPLFELELDMSMTLGGEAIEGTDEDGAPRIHHRSVSVQCDINCELSFTGGEAEVEWRWSVTERD